MVGANQKNLDLYLKKGTYKTDNLDVRSLKCTVMELLGSRGAAMQTIFRQSYTTWSLITPIADMKTIAKKLPSIST
jgi:hypothetical protein